jgi:hypothetical protein
MRSIQISFEPSSVPSMVDAYRIRGDDLSGNHLSLLYYRRLWSPHTHSRPSNIDLSTRSCGLYSWEVRVQGRGMLVYV